METTLERGAGLVLPIYSLPSRWGCGTLGREARDFIDFLKESGQTYWQVLPVCPTSMGDSPYAGLSAFAGNPYFIDLETLCEEGLLEEWECQQRDWGGHPAYVDYGKMYENRYPLLRLAYSRSHHQDTPEFQEFCRDNQAWLDDYALFMAVKNHFGGACWINWDRDIRLHEEAACRRYREMLAEEIGFWTFLQFKFYQQWEAVRAYANEQGILIIGDMPIYAALDSVDVWADYTQFQLDEEHVPESVAGVPPDAFSDEGQLWGNPLYDWEKMEEDDFSWWRRRMEISARLYDVIRIDHFIGIVRYFAIPNGAVNGKVGVFHKGPGKKFLEAMQEAAGQAKIIAEDLGVITDEVRKLKNDAGIPGMKVLEFGFDSGSDNDYLPHNHEFNSVVYAGTHDNETLAGYLQGISGWTKKHLMDYCAIRDEEEYKDCAQDRVIRLVYSSICSAAMLQVQDVLGLGNEARTNTPATAGNNWKWRLMPDQLQYEHCKYLKDLAWLYRRLPEKKEEKAAEEKDAENIDAENINAENIEAAGINTAGIEA